MELIQHQLLEERNLKRATKTLAWIRRFIDNNRVKEKVKTKKEPLSTHETEFKLMEMIKIYQNNLESKTLKHLNLNKQKEHHFNINENENGTYKCHGRTLVDYPIFTPKSTLLAKKLLEKAPY